MAARANGAPEVFDLDVLAREDTKTPFVFRIEGHDFVMADPEELDWHAQEALESNDLNRIFTAILGPDQFAEFDKLVIPGWKLERLTVAWSKHYGIEIPESSASAASSANTAPPSRPTSVVTTASGSRTSPPGG